MHYLHGDVGVDVHSEQDGPMVPAAVGETAKADTEDTLSEVFHVPVVERKSETSSVCFWA